MNLGDDANRLAAEARARVLIDRQLTDARRGRNIGVVAAARCQLELVYYALRDHHVRALDRSTAAA